MKKRAQFVCRVEHPVDHDEDGSDLASTRKALVGMKGEGDRNNGTPPEAPNAYSIVWANGAWGFYSAAEIDAVADLIVEEV